MSVDQEHGDAQRMFEVKARELALELILEKGLYGHIDEPRGDDETVERSAIMDIVNGSIDTYDCYCVKCKQVTPFIIKTDTARYVGGQTRSGHIVSSVITYLKAVCQRDTTIYHYIFLRVGKRLIKIGQYPSMADISFMELKGIEEGLEKLDRRELGTALGLYSHDAVSGAFVYLRRVFERMIYRAHERVAAKSSQVPNFATMRMDEKIEAVRAELPERLVKHRQAFGLLSQGIHELTDEQCKAMFPVVKAVVFQMVEEEAHKLRKARAEAETDVAFQALLQKTKGATDGEEGNVTGK